MQRRYGQENTLLNNSYHDACLNVSFVLSDLFEEVSEKDSFTARENNENTKASFFLMRANQREIEESGATKSEEI